MAKEVIMYEAFDGTIFPSRKDADEHDKRDPDLQFVEEYLESDQNPYHQAAQYTMAKITLYNYFRFIRETPNDKDTD